MMRRLSRGQLTVAERSTYFQGGELPNFEAEIGAHYGAALRTNQIILDYFGRNVVLNSLPFMNSRPDIEAARITPQTFARIGDHSLAGATQQAIFDVLNSEEFVLFNAQGQIQPNFYLYINYRHYAHILEPSREELGRDFFIDRFAEVYGPGLSEEVIGGIYDRLAEVGDIPFSTSAYEILRVLPAADPRRAEEVGWLLVRLDIFKSMISRLVDPRASQETVQPIVDSAIENCLTIAQIYVSNPEQRALFLYQALIQTGNILYFVMDRWTRPRGAASGSSDSRLVTEAQRLALEPMRYRIRVLFAALLQNQFPSEAEIQNGRIDLSRLAVFRTRQEEITQLLVASGIIDETGVILIEQREIETQLLISLTAESITEEEHDLLSSIFEDAPRITEEDQRLLAGITQQRAELDYLFEREPSYEAKAYAALGNLMLWGARSAESIDDAEHAYAAARHIDNFSVPALIGLANVYMLRANWIDQGRLEGDRDEVERLYQEAWRFPRFPA